MPLPGFTKYGVTIAITIFVIQLEAVETREVVFVGVIKRDKFLLSKLFPLPASRTDASKFILALETPTCLSEPNQSGLEPECNLILAT